MKPEDSSETSRAPGTLPPASNEARGTVGAVGRGASTLEPPTQRAYGGVVRTRAELGRRQRLRWRAGLALRDALLVLAFAVVTYLVLTYLVVPLLG